MIVYYVIVYKLIFDWVNASKYDLQNKAHCFTSYFVKWISEHLSRSVRERYIIY